MVATTYLNIGTVYDVKGDYGNALECFNQALAIWRKVLGEAHPNVALSYLNMGVVYHEQGEYKQALAAHTKALELFKHAHGETSLDVGDCYGNIGNVYAGMGKYSEAIEFFNKSLVIMQAEVGENHPLVAKRYNNIGEAYYRQGQYDQAIEFHQKDLSILQKIYGKQHWDLAQAYQELGKCYYAKNDLGRALDYYQKPLLALVPNFLSGEVYSNPGIGQSISPIKLLSALELKAEAFAGLYSTQSRDLKDLEMCMSTYRLASDLIDKIRSSYLAEGSKLFLGSKASHISDSAIYAFAVTKEALEIAAIPKDSTFDSLVQTLAVSLRNVARKTDYLRSATLLHQTLVKPLAPYMAGKSRWVIIPDGELYQIPFEALLRTEVVPALETDYRSLPYLAKQHEISYH
ncbi:CHAT domain-containing protein [candidate division KSB1 bacterium]|nr:CHAT domain-containing protein [candidate division KSB1 bacterium]